MGDKKLDKIITEIEQLFPLSKGVTVQSECPISLISDDIEAVAKKKTREFGKPMVPMRCEGFHEVSQSLIELTPKIGLNLIHCYRSINYE